MRIATLRRARRQEQLPGLFGIARVDRDSRHLVKRLRPGDIAVIDHLDLDQVSADALLAARVAAVVNASPSTSGRYPNLGTEIIVAAGVPLLDAVGTEVLTVVEEGERLRLDGAFLFRDLTVVATGERLTPEGARAATDRARAGLTVQLEAFAGNTTEYLRQEGELVLDGAGMPEIETRLDGRPVLVVVPGSQCRADLSALRDYIRENRPVLVGVDAGAEVLLETGLRPDLVVGDLDAVSDDTLACGAELVLRIDRDGHAPGQGRVQEMGLRAATLRSSAPSEDLAMLLADTRGASLIVTVGTHATLGEFLDTGRAGAASTFVTRLRVAGKLLDAQAVSRLYRRRPSLRPPLLLVAVCAAGLLAALAATGTGEAARTVQTVSDALSAWMHGLG